ncbi:MAG: Glutamate synthase [NADPH] small chain [Candidatus Ozemobacter sibiricus]|uniref:Glutamate synthase [NADPH] small chain n=1 Tax=Candidatus Ozemobacter sibiricus TaxID=2268124 RepID=A0A367ZRI6_9BACT|nr:MAG: Glutamate synthase [NADPH] small chain [Candidatus Ozemobacter sibiricus]
MSQEFSRLPIERLAQWILREEAAEGQIFGIHQSLFFTPQTTDRFTLMRYGERLETPIGVAAGPHTQMAQNLIAAWLCGARYLELKTVQTLDELKVSKPCIDAQDEGYNCEWSQELRLDDSFDEYLNAWILLHVLRHKFGWAKEPRGFLFNMSVGYNLEGIKQPNVQRFLDRMADARREIDAKRAALRPIYPKIDEIEIPSRLSDNITLSTMHGCPPEEIEKIGRYLITERGYHTTIKLNPTLLGPDHLRHILNDQLGFVTQVPDEAFGHDLKFPDAVALIKNLREAATQKGVQFSLKLTNTLESLNHKDVFPPHEKMMYMSGRALHPISINVAAKLQHEFDGQLDLTFSAGADCFNLPMVLAAGLKPVTVCTDLLKPGGYARLGQYLSNLHEAMAREGASTLDELALKVAGCSCGNVRKAALINLRRYAGTVPGLPAYRADARTGDTVKTARPLPPFDCIQAPCTTTCPAGQDIPSYLYYTVQGNYQAAYDVIRRTNPFPHVLGQVCDHHCQHRCTRSNYDNPLLIREVKRFIAARNAGRPPLQPGAPNGKKVAVIGAGPSGLACAYFLALDGFAVTVYETKAFAGGMVSDAIPAFRLAEEAIRRDIDGITALGVEIRYDQKIDRARFDELRRTHDFVYVAIGAQAAKKLGVPGEEAPGVIDALRFLSDVRHGRPVAIGPRVAVVGGGNSAMDAARTARRLVGETGKVVIVYRRTAAEMPADQEEVRAARAEGIELLERHAPVAVVVRDGRVAALQCQKMRLGEKGPDGRRRPEKIEGALVELPFDTIIPAIGQDLVADFLSAADLETDPGTGETKLPGVFAGGDAVRGPASIVKALADGKKAALAIIARAGRGLETGPVRLPKGLTPAQFQQRAARRVPGLALPEIEVERRQGFAPVVRELTEEEARREADRCLYCNDVCNVCVTVCPNRANRAYRIAPLEVSIYKGTRDGNAYRLEKTRTLRLTQEPQTLNIGDFCNECGNCTTFCPTSGAPYQDKPKFYLTEASWQRETNGYHLTPSSLLARVDGQVERLEARNGAFWYEGRGVRARLHPVTLTVETVQPADGAPAEIVLDHAVTMGLLFKSLKGSCFSA